MATTCRCAHNHDDDDFRDDDYHVENDDYQDDDVDHGY
jgi:hypothetical protein